MSVVQVTEWRYDVEDAKGKVLASFTRKHLAYAWIRAHERKARW